MSATATPKIEPTPEQLDRARDHVILEDLGIDELAELIAKAEAYDRLRKPAASRPLAPSERYECPRCEAPVPPELVFSNFDTHNAGMIPAVRTVTIHCPHCVAFFSRDFELRTGVWTPTTDATVVTDARKLAGLARRVNRITGTQLATAS